jgi:hypothetical protein
MKIRALFQPALSRKWSSRAIRETLKKSRSSCREQTIYDHLYGEIRIDNTLNHANGQEVALKPGAPVEVTVAADPEDTVKK